MTYLFMWMFWVQILCHFVSFSVNLVKVRWAQMLATCFVNQQCSHTPVLLHRHAIIALSRSLSVSVSRCDVCHLEVQACRCITAHQRLLPHKLTWLFNGDLNVTSHPLLTSHCTWRFNANICLDWSAIKSWEKPNIPTPALHADFNGIQKKLVLWFILKHFKDLVNGFECVHGSCSVYTELSENTLIRTGLEAELLFYETLKADARTAACTLSYLSLLLSFAHMHTTMIKSPQITLRIAPTHVQLRSRRQLCKILTG